MWHSGQRLCGGGAKDQGVVWRRAEVITDYHDPQDVTERSRH
jgi:hypothetical protein